MAPLGFHHTMAVCSSGKARTHRNHNRCIMDRCPQILLGNDCIYHHIRHPFPPDVRFRVNHHGNVATVQRHFHFRHVLAPFRRGSFNFCGLFINCPGKCHGSPYRCGNGQIRHDNGKTTLMQAAGDAACQISRTLYEYFHPLFLRYAVITQGISAGSRNITCRPACCSASLSA